ncbi:hypothetical protein CGCSCA1_v002230 [Colletotrichum siamense]|nr:hypothetical protein CGCSCA1_v002230 [Colletotrichum siamense]
MTFISREATIDAFKSARFLQQAYSQSSQMPWREISEMLNQAVIVAEGLRNNVGACKIREFRVEIDRQVAIRQAAKTALEDHAATEMDDIRRQREELDKREQALITDMTKKGSKQKALFSGLIDRFLDSRFGKSAEQLEPQTERGEATEESTEETTESYTKVSKEESAEQSAEDMEFDSFD